MSDVTQDNLVKASIRGAPGNYVKANIFGVSQRSTVKANTLVSNSPRTFNLVKNPSFEVDTTTWTLESEFSRVTTDAYKGTASVKQISSSGFQNFYESDSGISVVPNTNYVASFYYKLTINSGAGTVFQVNGTTAFDNNLGQEFLGAASSWTRVSVSFNSGAHTKVYLRIFNNDSDVVGFYDAFQVQPGSTATTYLDGSLGTGYFWTGTAHDSISYQGGSQNYVKANISGKKANVVVGNIKSTITSANKVRASIGAGSEEYSSNDVLVNLRGSPGDFVRANISGGIATLTKDNLVKASILVVSSKNNTVKANILSRDNLKDNSVKANIKVTTTQSNQVKANIRNTYTYNNAVKANIRVTTAQNNLVKANIKGSQSQNNAVKANIKTTNTSTNIAKANIRITNTWNNLVKASIVVINTKQNIAIANILKRNDTKNNLVKANIRISSTSSNIVKAHLYYRQTSSNSVIANIIGHVTKGNAVVANIRDIVISGREIYRPRNPMLTKRSNPYISRI